MNTLIVLTREIEEYEENLGNLHLPNLEVHIPKDERQISRLLPHATIILGDPPIARHYINAASKLKWMQSTFAGVDSMIHPRLRTDYLLTNVKETYGKIMAEYVFAYILMFEKELIQNLTNQKEKQWVPKPYTELSEKTIGIMGVGSIGSEIATIAKAFGMKVLGYCSAAHPVEPFDEVFDATSQELFLRESDYLVSVLPKTARTKHIIDRQMFTMMKPSCVFMNIGRGDTVQEKDLIEALRAEKIRAAVLDVFEEEPLSQKSVLWDMKNVFITPHVSGYTVSPKIFDIFEENYKRFLAGESLLYQVDFQKGY